VEKELPMNIDSNAGLLAGKPVVDTVEREHRAQLDILAAVEGMSVEAATRCCKWAVARLAHDAKARSMLSLVDALIEHKQEEKKPS